jgi:hypothetical protein
MQDHNTFVRFGMVYCVRMEVAQACRFSLTAGVVSAESRYDALLLFDMRRRWRARRLLHNGYPERKGGMVAWNR